MIRQLFGKKAFWVAGAFSVAVILYLALGVFGVQALFIDDEINEEFGADSAPVEPAASGGETVAEEAAGAEPASGPVAVSSGEFHPVDHQGSGTATVYRTEDGSHVLRLENLNVDNGPDLFVYAVAAPDASNEATVLDAGFVNAGKLKGNVGNQTYELPPDFDPEVHRAVSVWCQRFTSNFATAPLT